MINNYSDDDDAQKKNRERKETDTNTIRLHNSVPCNIRGKDLDANDKCNFWPELQIFWGWRNPSVPSPSPWGFPNVFIWIGCGCGHWDPIQTAAQIVQGRWQGRQISSTGRREEHAVTSNEGGTQTTDDNRSTYCCVALCRVWQPGTK